MTRSRNYLVALLATMVAMLMASPARAGSWSNKYAFGATLQGDLYTPTTPAASPAILVAIHYCGGSSSSAHGWFDSYADQNGFYIIAPQAGSGHMCFDASASRDGDKLAVVTMVKYLITNKHADATRVFAAGYSSGGCMTNTLLAVYPDVFAGGSAMPGFPAGAWPANDFVCMECGQKPSSTDGTSYATAVKKVFTWNGQYGCSQQWVGGGDQYDFNYWLPVVVSEVQNLAGLGAGMTATSPKSGWTRTEYKDSNGNVRLQTNLGPSSQMHDLTGAGLNGDVISFLGLDKPSGACGLSTTSTTGGGGMSGGATGGAGGSSTATGGSGGHANGGATGGGGHATGGSGTGGSGTGTGGNGTGGNGTGGMVATGGVTGTGGVTHTGGVTGTGGVTSTGGVTGTGGSSSGTGGSTGTGGSDENGSSGCSCAVDGTAAGHKLGTALLLLIGLAGWRRRARRR